MGWRELVEKGTSPLSGDYVVEDVRVPDDDGKEAYYRRLIFLSSPDTVQTEVPLHLEPAMSPKAGLGRPLLGKLTSDYQRSLLVGLALLGSRCPDSPLAFVAERQEALSILILGLGGGSLSSFLRVALPKATLTAVELDAQLVNLARRWFGLQTDAHLIVHTQDALAFVSEAAKAVESKKSDQKWSMIIVDVAGASESDGLKAPPPSFLSTSTLSHYKSLLKPEGCLAMNVMTRDESRLNEVRELLHGNFPSVSEVKATEDLNSVFLARPFATDSTETELRARITALGTFMTGLSQEGVKEEKNGTASQFQSLPQSASGKKKGKKKKGKCGGAGAADANRHDSTMPTSALSDLIIS